MAVQPFDIEGQLPVEINFQTQVTIENFSVRENKPLTPKTSALGVTGIAEGVPIPEFSFRVPILATPQMTEQNLQRFMRASGTSMRGQKFTLAFRNSLGARKTLVNCRCSVRAYNNAPGQGDAAAEVSGTAEEMIDT